MRDEDPYQFKNEAIVSDKVINKFQEKASKSCLEYGIGIIHDGLTKQEISLTKQLFQRNAIRLLVVTQKFCWEISDLKSNMVLLMDVERFEGTERRMIEYPIPDVLQMQGLACLTMESNEGQRLAPKCRVMCYTPRKDYFVKFLEEPLPVESNLVENLHDMLNAEIVEGTITSKQEAVDWLTWTFMYRRLGPNPNYYNMSGRSAQHINDFMSQLVEDTVEDLEAAGCVIVDEENDLDLKPGNLG